MLAAYESEQILQHLSKHPQLSVNEIAEDLELELEEVAESLEELRQLKKVVEIYEVMNGYIWSAL